MEKFPITPTGYERLVEELKHLKTVERPAIIEAIATARELGDLSENAEYHAAREKQAFAEGRIIELEDKMARAEIIDPAEFSGDVVRFGATVRVVDEDSDEEMEYQIVGEYEADLNAGRISLTSPFARALIGKKTGDSVEVKTPKGHKSLEILEVGYALV